MWTDEKIQSDVLKQLLWEPGVNSADIGVTVKSGVVTLHGKVDSLAKKWAIEKAVKRMPRVKQSLPTLKSRFLAIHCAPTAILLWRQRTHSNGTSSSRTIRSK